MADAQKISLYSLAVLHNLSLKLLEVYHVPCSLLPDLKNTSDDAIPNYLNSLKFKQNHTLSDVRLVLGYLAFGISAATFYWDYKLGFESTKYYTAAAVAVYSILNAALTFWIWVVEKGKVYIGTSPIGDKVEISTYTQKHIPVYHITVTYYNASSPTVPNILKVSRPFTQWFNAAGQFVPLPFQQMFAGEVPVIGKADPIKAVATGGKVLQTAPGLGLQQTLDGIAADHMRGATVVGSDSPAIQRKGIKSRKKT